MNHKIYPFGKTILLLAAICLLLTACQNTTDKHSTLPRLNQTLQQAKDTYEDKDSAGGARILETFFAQLPAQSTDDSIHTLIYRAMDTYYFFIYEQKCYAHGLHFYDSLSTTIAPNTLLDSHRADIYANSAFFAMQARELERSEELYNNFLKLPPTADPIRDIRNNEHISAVAGALKGNAERVLVLEKIMDIYHKSGVNYPNIGRSMVILGSLYFFAGRYEESMRTNEEALEFFRTHGENQATPMAYNRQAYMYHMLELYDKALEYNSKSIEVAIRLKGPSLGDSYRKRADIWKDLHRTDSTVYYIRKGREASQANQSLNGIIGSDVSLALIYTQLPDSVHKALPLLRPLLADTANMEAWIKEEVKCTWGRALYANNQIAAAIPVLESSVASLHQMGQTQDESEICALLMEAYLKMGMNDRFIARYPHYTELQDTLQRQKALHSVAMANIRFGAKEKEQQNQLLTAEVALKSSRMQTLVILGCALLMLLSAGFLIRQRTLKHRLRLRAQEQEFSEKQLHEQAERLHQLIASRQELNTHNEDLLRQLAEVQSTRDKSCDLDSVLEKLQPRLLTREEEEQFRRAFASLYPSVLHRLRSVCANATRSEELLCMLIVLKQTNEEISRTLGVSRSTVLKNRYRLRVKLGLPEGADIDTEVQAMLLPS